MDYLVIESEKIDNYIPLGYKKEEPEEFYNIVYEHGLWIEKCQNIVIPNVPTINHFYREKNIYIYNKVLFYSGQLHLRWGRRVEPLGSDVSHSLGMCVSGVDGYVLWLRC